MPTSAGASKPESIFHPRAIRVEENYFCVPCPSYLRLKRLSAALGQRLQGRRSYVRRFCDLTSSGNPNANSPLKFEASRICGVTRRAKNIVIELADKSVIWVNLGMTGRLLHFPSPPTGSDRPTHATVRFRLEGGGIVIFDDVRRFGTVEHPEAGSAVSAPKRWGLNL